MIVTSWERRLPRGAVSASTQFADSLSPPRGRRKAFQLREPWGSTLRIAKRLQRSLVGRDSVEPENDAQTPRLDRVSTYHARESRRHARAPPILFVISLA